MGTQNQLLQNLRNIINENLRVQRGNEQVNYISMGNALVDVSTKQSHCIFGRRGCGKSLLLHHSGRNLATDIRAIYINCEDFKHHTFPNVLIEILESIFKELDKNFYAWFGKKKKIKKSLSELLDNFKNIKSSADTQQVGVTASESNERNLKKSVNLEASGTGQVAKASVSVSREKLFTAKTDIEKKYVHNENKLRELNHNLPNYKETIRNFFEYSNKLKSLFIQVDDFYHLNRADQPFVADYIHRMCKDTQLKFKIATLKHNSVLYIERTNQPIGIQERHDYQPINVDLNFEQFERTRNENKKIFYEYSKMSGMSNDQFDDLFKGKGFDRLVLAGGGVPRDCLSFFLEVLDRVKSADPEGKIGKDDVRFLSKNTFERRIDELKQDSEGQDQEALLRGIVAIRGFCLEKKSNVFLVAENEIQKDDELKTLLYRLLDYRIIHKVGNSLTHKSKTGSNYQAFAVDIGCYAYMRNLKGRFTEIDLAESDVKEKMRSSPILEGGELRRIWKQSEDKNVENALEEQEN